MRMSGWCWVLVVACREPDDPPKDTTTTPTTETGTTAHTGAPTGPTALTGETAVGHTGSTAHTAVPPFDCSTVSPNPVSVRPVPGGRGYHGLAFDLNGYLYGMDSGYNLVRTDAYGASNIVAPVGSNAQGMDTLPSGEIVVASDLGLIVAIDPNTGGTRTLATGIYGYGVVVGPDGLVYVGDRTHVWRVDPVAETSDLWLANSSAQSLGFSPDGLTMYFTTTFGFALWEQTVDANVDPVGNPRQLSDFGRGYRDGLVVDACGLIYVPDYSTGKMYRTDPTTGNNTVYVNFTPFSNYGHGAVWGTGTFGWPADALYVPQPYNGNTVGEIVTGVPGLPFP